MSDYDRWLVDGCAEESAAARYAECQRPDDDDDYDDYDRRRVEELERAERYLREEVEPPLGE